MANDNMEEQAPELIYIADEDGNEEEFEVIMRFEVDDSDRLYMLVVPTEQTEEDMEEVYAFRYEEEGEELKLFTIEDEQEWSEVEETFNTLVAELEDGDA